MKTRDITKIGTLTLLMMFAAVAAFAGDPGEWGDAPEGSIAYPSTGVIGSFPTCQNTGPAQWIWHSPLCWAFFGPGFDFEMEGNAGNCGMFPPYDADECFADNDAGLIIPPAYTIVPQGGGLVVVPCQVPGPLGYICTWAIWGGNVDIHVTNTMPVDGFLNVLMDFDQSGSWGGASNCGSAPAPEHVLVNWPVPMGFSGPVSALGPQPFLLGPRDRYIWTRFSVTEQAVQLDWDGSGIFEDGETEDYLLELIHPSATSQTSWTTIKSLYR